MEKMYCTLSQKWKQCTLSQKYSNLNLHLAQLDWMRRYMYGYFYIQYISGPETRNKLLLLFTKYVFMWRFRLFLAQCVVCTLHRRVWFPVVNDTDPRVRIFKLSAWISPQNQGVHNGLEWGRKKYSLQFSWHCPCNQTRGQLLGA